MSAESERSARVSWPLGRCVTIAGLVSFGIGAFICRGPNGGQSTTGAAFILSGIAAIIGYWAIRFGLEWGRVISKEMKVASTPVTSPAGIAAVLEEEWGRPPTIVEVAAVHQMLTTRRNEALFATGLSLGGLYLMGENGGGR